MNSTGKPAILIVEDIIMLKQMFVSEFSKHFPGYDIVAVETLEQARNALRQRHFAAVATDCGFPTDDRTEREHGNVNGIHLIQEIRAGALGEANKNIPIAFNSAEMDEQKGDRAKRFGGNTGCFRKGAIYPTIRGRNASQYTPENSTGQSIRWIQKQLAMQQSASRTDADTSPTGPGHVRRILERIGWGRQTR